MYSKYKLLEGSFEKVNRTYFFLNKENEVLNIVITFNSEKQLQQ